MSTQTESYPSREITLADGTVLRLRKTEGSEMARLERSLAESSHPEVEPFRSLGGICPIQLFTASGEKDAVAAFVIVNGREELAGLGRFHRLPGSDLAEAYVYVKKAFRNRGIGLQLVQRLTVQAHEKNLAGFVGTVNARGLHVLQVLRHHGEGIIRTEVRDPEYLVFYCWKGSGPRHGRQ
ncbi:MAG: GNAT family N-acetyltransferase [Acidobacteria bacterium]|nr:GNAT family N-acetyltransferase [Acidobacteriota bacterium]